jgi:carbamoyl-phosphate synthase small subunit
VITGRNVKGIVISDGPGDPSHTSLKNTIRTAADLSVQMPVYGVCLGGQILGAAMGGSTYKMKFGHRGGNQPVKYNGRVVITSQNHGYAIDGNSMGKELIVDQINLNDGTAEGFSHRDLPVYASFYRPVASPGPWDTAFQLDKFSKAVREGCR